jgi:hypothetical protein
MSAAQNEKVIYLLATGMSVRIRLCTGLQALLQFRMLNKFQFYCQHGRGPQGIDLGARSLE